ncbi:MarR family winged helix-turn-helix transcriptional regulator [Nonomuraea sp. CA-218870]|uniref:MarR family winged helix-turn-helix transcriptional regulator n=1 Tax=Nonomuraea sp. CA-218870 TaxID=3239998 RepID=UPI003D945016
MTDPSIALVLGGGSLLALVGRELHTETERLFAPYGLTSQQAALLLNAAPGNATPSDLKGRLGTDTAGMTRLVDRLVAKRLLRRVPHPGDRRSVVIELTPEGLALVPELAPVFGAISRRMLAGFSADELAQLAGLLRRMLGNLKGDGTRSSTEETAHGGLT